jgi:hypothetical protein
MFYSELQNIKKLRKIIEVLAYSSLGLDCSIALLTLISLKQTDYSKYLGIFNYSLTIEVIITLILFTLLLFMSNSKNQQNNCLIFYLNSNINIFSRMPLIQRQALLRFMNIHLQNDHQGRPCRTVFIIAIGHRKDIYKNLI